MRYSRYDDSAPRNKRKSYKLITNEETTTDGTKRNVYAFVEAPCEPDLLTVDLTVDTMLTVHLSEGIKATSKEDNIKEQVKKLNDLLVYNVETILVTEVEPEVLVKASRHWNDEYPWYQ